ncbi:MAG: helix-turn-helix transcriptional regulator [Gammaproteobacteria bacterium]|nr:helix-turn-helix domain containing protein [Gammaproteobacteria bacterium]MXY54943.1 helix-turn-helix transcriptional regulator [Gammaproteobacteria bacterium]MYF29211.1 helix-turn-helix transcriptional regulator [Gammaproteobacteria bacterium]MYK47209.1 helix-turn-helix transcriptional regulator [Gammaproteobacteria bacterium]
MPRDSDRTRANILAAAVSEFAARGYAGARVDRIASRAGANKRMIYHHFGGKKAIFQAALAEQLTMGSTTENLVRLWMHEALERGDADIVSLPERRKLAAERIEATCRAQQRGELPACLDPALLTMARLALDAFPLAFPQLVHVYLGNRATSRDFRKAWTGFIADWHGSAPRRRTKPRLRLDRDGIAQAATRPREPRRPDP